MLQWNILELIFTGDVVTGVLRGGGAGWRHGETDWINYGKKEQMRERGRRGMCLKNNEENPKAAGVMWQPMKPPSSEKSAQFCCTYNLYQVCTACSQLLTVFFLHAFNTKKFCKLLYNSATQKHLTHTHTSFLQDCPRSTRCFLSGPDGATTRLLCGCPLTPSRWAAHWRGNLEKKENGYSLASIRFQLSAAIHTKRFFVNKTLDQRINAEYLDTSWASGE